MSSKPVSPPDNGDAKKFGLFIFIVVVLNIITAFVPGLNSLHGLANYLLIGLNGLAAAFISDQIYPLIK